MYYLVAFVSTFAVALASYCCIPPQWEGQVGFVVGVDRAGKGQYASAAALIAYDGVRRIIGERETATRSSDGRSIQIDVLMDYNHDTKYIRMGSTCIKTKLNRRWEDGCIPNNATLVSSNAEFGFGGNKIGLNTFRMDLGPITAMFSVTATGCIPVLESVRGTLDGNNFMQNVGYVNISAGISNPLDLAVPPVSCENAPLVQAHYVEGMFHDGMVGRRSISIFGF